MPVPLQAKLLRVLDNGEVFYNDQPTPLAVDLHNVDFHSVFNQAIKQYSGKLAYANGRVMYGTFQPFAHCARTGHSTFMPRRSR